LIGRFLYVAGSRSGAEFFDYHRERFWSAAITDYDGTAGSQRLFGNSLSNFAGANNANGHSVSPRFRTRLYHCSKLRLSALICVGRWQFGLRGPFPANQQHSRFGHQ
jgi:hypothetical protein